MRVQFDFSKQGASANLFHDIFKSMWSDMNITKNKGMTRYHLDIDIEYDGRPIRLTKELIRRRLDDTLRLASADFYPNNLKIGEEVKCSVCNGTGKSTYPSDFGARSNV